MRVFSHITFHLYILKHRTALPWKRWRMWRGASTAAKITSRARNSTPRTNRAWSASAKVDLMVKWTHAVVFARPLIWCDRHAERAALPQGQMQLGAALQPLPEAQVRAHLLPGQMLPYRLELPWVHADGRKFAFWLKIFFLRSAAEEVQTPVSSTPSSSSKKPEVITKESTNENGTAN
jgi:hypothetical protein